MDYAEKSRDSKLPIELQRYTIAPSWVQQENDEKRRRRALEEFRRRVQVTN
jgi:hypothetical protein